MLLWFASSSNPSD